MPGALSPFGHPDRFAAHAWKRPQLPITVVPVWTGLVPVVVYAPDADAAQQRAALEQSLGAVPGAGKGTRPQRVRKDMDRRFFQPTVGRDQRIQAGDTLG